MRDLISMMLCCDWLLLNSKDRNVPIRAVENQPITAEHHALKYHT